MVSSEDSDDMVLPPSNMCREGDGWITDITFAVRKIYMVMWIAVETSDGRYLFATRIVKAANIGRGFDYVLIPSIDDGVVERFREGEDQDIHAFLYEVWSR